MIEELSLPWGWPKSADAAPTSTAVDIAELVQLHAGLLFRIAHTVTRNRAEAEDVVQDTFVRVLQNQHKLAAVVEMRPWLVRIAWNLAVDRQRRLRPTQADDLLLAALVDPQLSAEAAVADRQHLTLTLQAIDGLPRGEREALLLHSLDELTPGEVAAVLQKSPSAARALLHRARTRLKQRLAQKGIA